MFCILTAVPPEAKINILDLITHNWGVLLALGGVIGFIVKNTHNFTKLQYKQENMTADISRTLTTLTDNYTVLENRVSKQYVEILEQLSKTQEAVASLQKEYTHEQGRLNEKIDSIQKRNRESQERTKLIMTGTEVSLMALKNTVTDAKVQTDLTNALNGIIDFKTKKASI